MEAELLLEVGATFTLADCYEFMIKSIHPELQVVHRHEHIGVIERSHAKRTVVDVNRAGYNHRAEVVLRKKRKKTFAAVTFHRS
jgi:hypothetical protein